MSTTSSPDESIAAARLAATVDLPSPGRALVTITTRGGSSTFMYIRFVRSLRNASDAGAWSTCRPRASTAIVAASPALRSSTWAVGMLPTTLTGNLLSMSSLVRSRRSTLLRSRA